MSKDKLTKAAARDILQRAIRAGHDQQWRQGYAWFSTEVVPAIQTLPPEPRTKADRRLHVLTFRLIGDIYDLYFNAPKAALRAYRRCIRLFPQDAYAWTEIGSMLEKIGRYGEATSALLKAQRLDPDDDDPENWLKSVEQAIRRSSRPLYRPGDRCWEACECLAQLRPKKALDILKRTRSIRARQCRARALAALGDVDGHLAEWEAISKRCGPVGLESADWFMLPDAAWDSPRFWRTILRIGPRVTLGSWILRQSDPCMDFSGVGTDDHDCHRANLREFRLVARLHVARTQNDLHAAEAICRRFPKWTEAVRLRDRLRRRRGRAR